MRARSRRVARHVDDLELDPVRVVEEDRVVAEDVAVLLRAALDRRAVLLQPLGAIVDRRARGRLDRQMVEPEPIAVGVSLGLGLAEADRRAGPAEVPDGLAALPLDLRDAVPAERAEEVAIERQA